MKENKVNKLTNNHKITAGDIQTKQPLPFFCFGVLVINIFYLKWGMDISLINMVIISYIGLICHKEDNNKCQYQQVW